jgi:hypothetical protein
MKRKFILSVFICMVILNTRVNFISARAENDSYRFDYQTAVLTKNWFNSGYEVEYQFKEDGVIAKLGKISNKLFTISQAENGIERVGKVAIGKYVKNGFKVLKQLDISEKNISININPGETLFYWYLEGKGTAVDDKYIFNWTSLFKNRILTPEGIYSVPIAGYDTEGWFLNPSLYWEYAVLNGYYGGNNVWLRKDLGWAFYYYPQLLCLVYIPLISKDGVIYTKPTSSYLKNLYGFGELFYDTRFNTDSADFLVQVGKTVGEPADIWAARKYQDYFLKHAARYHHTIGSGLLIADYSWNQKPSVITHASLNHNLAEINFLLRLGDPNGISLAKQILEAIKGGTYQWISPEKDLYYAYYDHNDYHGKDYKTLTLRDLDTTKQLLSNYSWGNVYLPAIEYLINIKSQYISRGG